MFTFFPSDTSKTAEATGPSWAARSSHHREQEEEEQEGDEEEEEEDVLTEPTEGPSSKPAAAQLGVSSSRAGRREAGC